MQWTDGKNAGFGEGTPWLKINDNYKEVNVEKNLTENSVLAYYRKLIALRKANEVFRYGTYRDFYRRSNKILAYLREYDGDSLFVVCNFSRKETKFAPPKEVQGDFALVLGNYADAPETLRSCTLRPYEAAIYRVSPRRLP